MSIMTTNGDRIRSMTNEELASFIYNEIENVEWDENGNNNYEDNWLEWLEEECMVEDRKLTPDDLYNIIIGFHDGETVKCPRDCTGCKLWDVCDNITDIVDKLIGDWE